MQIKLIASAAAITLIAGLAAASAEERFSTMDRIPASEMSALDMRDTRGARDVIFELKLSLIGSPPRFQYVTWYQVDDNAYEGLTGAADAGAAVSPNDT